ncbi:MAG: HAD family hydrolase [Anaerolineales bacterium]|nr:HAD family hydrolase [Anaerolineales bacterium]
MPVDVARIRALCFDVDGTLRDTDNQMVSHLAGLLSPVSFLFTQRNPLPLARQAIMALEDPGTILLGLPDRLGFDHHLARLAGALRRPRSGKRQEQFSIIAGVQEALEHLRPVYPMAVVSARGQRSTLAFLNHFELGQYFQAIATSQTCRHTKPYPDPVLWAAEQMGAPPSACLMVGDTTVDIRAGKAAGAQAVGLLCGFGEEHELRQAGADAILPCTSDLVALLLEGKIFE